MLSIYFRLIFITFSWVLLFCILQNHLSAEGATRGVSFIHSVLSALLSGYVYMTDGFSGFGKRTTDKQCVVALLSVGYFIYDTIVGAQLGILESHFLLHHIVAISSLAYALIYGISGSEIVLCLFFTEASNPFYHAHWFLQNLRPTHKTLSNVNIVAFLTAFVAFRFFLASVLIFSALRSRRVPRYVKFTGVSLLCMNVAFSTVLGQQFLCYLGGQGFTLD